MWYNKASVESDDLDRKGSHVPFLLFAAALFGLGVAALLRLNWVEY